MKIFIYLLTLAILSSSCKDKISQKIDKPKQEVVVADTIINKYNATTYKTVLEKKDTVLTINNQKFNLSYSAKIEPSKMISYPYIYSEKGKVYKNIYKGYNATYTISLTDSFGKIVFSKILTKDNFKKIFDGDILTRTEAFLPNFIGYLNNFNAFLFTIEFLVPDSDVGGQCFFMINNKGAIIENSMNNYYGGGDCDGEIEIPMSGDFILTCRKILNKNGKNINITKEKFWQIGTKLINENTILVIQDYNDTTNVQNAKFIDNFGKILKSFKYNGYYNTLGYTVPMYFDSLNNNFILLDEEQKNIRIVNKNKPLLTYTVAFNKMKSFNNDKQENELVFDLNTEFSNNTFAFDTLTNSFRYKKNDL